MIIASKYLLCVYSGLLCYSAPAIVYQTLTIVLFKTMLMVLNRQFHFYTIIKYFKENYSYSLTIMGKGF